MPTLQLLGLAVMLSGSPDALQPPPGFFSGEGILPVGTSEAIVLAKRTECWGANSGPADSVVALHVDAATGNWKEVTRRFPGGRFLFAGGAERRYWIFGDLSTEGPAREVFVLTSTGNPAVWTTQTIYRGDSSLEGVSVLSSDKLIARVRHLRRGGPEGWRGGIFEHRSDDGGQTWRQVNAAGRATGQPMEPITEEKGGWRLSSGTGGGFSIQQNQDPTWRTVHVFPPPSSDCVVPSADFLQIVRTQRGQPVSVKLSTPKNAESGTYLLIHPPAHGSATNDGPNFTYVPDANYEGEDSFIVYVRSGTEGAWRNSVFVRIRGSARRGRR